MKTVIVEIKGNDGTSYSRSIIPKAKNKLKKQELFTRAICKGIKHEMTKENGEKSKEHLTFFVEFDLFNGVEAFLTN